MEVLIIASGSDGNAALVSSGGTSILVDIGVTAMAVRRRLAVFGRTEEEISAILISHEHSDHCRGLPVFLRRRQVPVWATSGTWTGLPCRSESGGELVSGRSRTIGSIEVLPVATSHDAREPVGFVLDDGRHRLAVCTDTGIFTGLLEQRLRHCHLLLLEANHDPDMLRHGSYPWPLKQRIASRLGHLANHQTEEAVERLRSDDLKAVVGLHLSAENNSTDMVHEVLSRCSGEGVAVDVVPRAHMLGLNLEDGEVTLNPCEVPPSGRKRRV